MRYGRTFYEVPNKPIRPGMVGALAKHFAGQASPGEVVVLTRGVEFVQVGADRHECQFIACAFVQTEPAA